MGFLCNPPRKPKASSSGFSPISLLSSPSDFDGHFPPDRQVPHLCVHARANTAFCVFLFKVLDITREMVTYARSHVDDVEFSAEDALRSDYDFLSEV